MPYPDSGTGALLSVVTSENLAFADAVAAAAHVVESYGARVLDTLRWIVEVRCVGR
jgi:hypothetical protein